MKKLVGSIWTRPDGRFMPLLHCVNQTGDIDSGVTETLLSLVYQISGNSLACLQSMIREVEFCPSGKNSSSEHNFSINSINLHFQTTTANSPVVIIANDYIDEFSEAFGKPQEFTLEQLKLSINFWEQFLERVKTLGIQQSRNLRCECIFPEN